MTARNATKVIVLCFNSSGEPEFHTCSVTVSVDEIATGVHYELAKDSAVKSGFIAPMIAFDANDYASKQLGELLAWV